MSESQELYKRYRPQKLSEVVGQDDAVNTLRDFIRRKAVPHFLLFAGESGCGKTTTARILKRALNCSDIDFHELNIADLRGIDVVRDIRSHVMQAPLGGDSRVWLLDEAARASVDAQNAFLKLLEDTPEHVYFIMATTEPQRLLATVRNRATIIRFKALPSKELENIVNGVVAKEGIKTTEAVVDRIVKLADGSPRKALVLLNQVMGIEGEEGQSAAVDAGDATKDAIELARALVNPRCRFTDLVKVLNGIEGLEDQCEGIRRLVLSYMASVALKNPKLAGRAVYVIQSFDGDFFSSGKAGLVSACWEATGAGK